MIFILGNFTLNKTSYKKKRKRNLFLKTKGRSIKIHIMIKRNSQSLSNLSLSGHFLLQIYLQNFETHSHNIMSIKISTHLLLLSEFKMNNVKQITAILFYLGL